FIGSIVWKGSAALAGSAGPPATIPPVTPLIPLNDVWTKVATFSGRDSGRTVVISLASGTLRVTWQYSGTAGSKFVISLARNKTQETTPIDGRFGSGSGVVNYFVLFPGQDYFFLVEALGQWTLDVDMRVN